MKATATISLNEDCSFDRARALTRMIRNQMGRLLKTKEIRGLGNIEKTANSMTHIHLLLEMTQTQFDSFKLIFDDVCKYYSQRYVGHFEPCFSEEGYLHYIGKLNHTDNHCDW